jgi:hypothetical protein
MLPDEQTTEQQFEIFRKMTPERRLEVAYHLWRTARELKRAGLRMLHPDWSAEQVERETNHAFLHTRT